MKALFFLLILLLVPSCQKWELHEVAIPALSGFTCHVVSSPIKGRVGSVEGGTTIHVKIFGGEGKKSFDRIHWQYYADASGGLEFAPDVVPFQSQTNALSIEGENMHFARTYFLKPDISNRELSYLAKYPGKISETLLVKDDANKIASCGYTVELEP